jgi:hypothetical protein
MPCEKEFTGDRSLGMDSAITGRDSNTDLAGAMDHRFSILEAQRAVQQLLDQVIAG